MSLLVTGSIGIDTVEAPSGKINDALGGSVIYFALAGSFFSPVRLVGVVGDDCPEGFLKPLHDNANIDMAGLEVREGSKTFRWHGRYHQDVNQRDTIAVELNVLGEAGPTIPPEFLDSKYIFLANTHPDLQLELLSQLHKPSLVVADTMDLWITEQRSELENLLKQIDGLVINDSEAELFTGNSNIIAAGMEMVKLVRRFVVIKKGQHGCLIFVDDGVFPLPCYPVLDVVDPTGAGDSFAGAMMGFLAAEDRVDAASLRRAVAYGTVTAGFEIEDFSVNRLLTLDRKQIDARLAGFREITGF